MPPAEVANAALFELVSRIDVNCFECYTPALGDAPLGLAAVQKELREFGHAKTNLEEAFVENYFDAVIPLTGTGNIPSMSVGDIVLYKNEFWMCDKYGWTELKELNERRAESMA